MRLLLDTHILLWMSGFDDRLGPNSRKAIGDPANSRYLSVASVWEIAIKCATGKLIFPIARLDALLDDLATISLPITNAHAIAAGALPRHHADPFDRMLVAQAWVEGLILVTADPAMTRYEVPQLRG